MSLSRTILNGATFHINSTNVTIQGAHPFTLLYNHICAAAFDNTDAFEDTKCYPGTRTLLLERLESWIAAPGNSDRLVTWINGPMGAGKTAIARTLADRAMGCNKLIGTFMFSRTFPGRNDESRFVTTLAYQLAISIPLSRPFIEEQILHNPAILQQSLNQQLDLLILEPLRKMREKHSAVDVMTLPNFIIVDGLDECGGAKSGGKEEQQLKVLDLIRRLALSQHIFPFIILVLSRPERHLKNWFAKGTLHRVTYQLRLDKSYKPDDDIHLYVTQGFLAILEDHPSRDLLPVGWPYQVRNTDYRKPINAINFIVASSAGQFIYPSVVMRFVRSQHHRPDKRLLNVLRHGRSAQNEDSISPDAVLDALYHEILEATDDHETVRKLLAYDSFGDCAPWTAVPLCRILKLLNISEQDLKHPIDQLESLLTLTLKPFLTFYHASFCEFLLDPQRSKHWYMDIDKHASEFAIGASKLFHEEHYIGAQKSYFNIFVMACQRTPLTHDVLREIERWCRFTSCPSLMRFLSKVPMSNFVRRWDVRSRAFTDLLGLHLYNPGKRTLERVFISELASYVKPQVEFCLTDPQRFSIFLHWVFCMPITDSYEPLKLPGQRPLTKLPPDLRRLFWAVMDWRHGCRHLQTIFSIPSPEFLDNALVILLRQIGNTSTMVHTSSKGWSWLMLFLTSYGPSEKLWMCVLDSEGELTPHLRHKLRDSYQMTRFFDKSPEFRQRSASRTASSGFSTLMDSVLETSSWTSRKHALW